MKSILDSRLIGVTGLMGSGKDTISNMILKMKPDVFRLRAFAAPLKQALIAMFGWTAEQIEDRKFKEEEDPDWGFSPRKAMQLLGTEYGRQLLRDDIWVHAAKNFHKRSLMENRGTIMTDVRFNNEVDWIRSEPNSVIIHVIDPEHDYTIEPKHVSERGVSRHESDVVIVNDKRLGFDALKQSLSALVTR